MADIIAVTKDDEVRSARITIRIAPSLKSALEDVAKRERRSIADVIIYALEAGIAKRVRKGSK